MPTFVETPMCKSKQNCVACRNDENFRKQMEQQFGTWECPLKIAIGTPLEQMPQEIRDSEERKRKQIEEAQKRQQAVQAALDALELVVPGNSLMHIDTIRSFMFPNTKTPAACANGGAKIGEVDENCCGGKIKKVDAFSCTTQTVTTARKCMQCMEFRKKR
jgi:hypothetical protein